MASSAARLRAREKKNGRGTILRIDRLVRERALRVELREVRAELLVRGRAIKSDAVFFQRGDHSVAREHRGALDDGGRADAIYTHQRCKRDRELADEMIHRRLADVV